MCFTNSITSTIVADKELYLYKNLRVRFYQGEIILESPIRCFVWHKGRSVPDIIHSKKIDVDWDSDHITEGFHSSFNPYQNYTDTITIIQAIERLKNGIPVILPFCAVLEKGTKAKVNNFGNVVSDHITIITKCLLLNDDTLDEIDLYDIVIALRRI